MAGHGLEMIPKSTTRHLGRKRCSFESRRVYLHSFFVTGRLLLPAFICLPPSPLLSPKLILFSPSERRVTSRYRPTRAFAPDGAYHGGHGLLMGLSPTTAPRPGAPWTFEEQPITPFLRGTIGKEVCLHDSSQCERRRQRSRWNHSKIRNET